MERAPAASGTADLIDILDRALAGDPVIVADSNAKAVMLDRLAQSLYGKGADEEPHSRTGKNRAAIDSFLKNFTFSSGDKLNRSLRLYDPESTADIDYDAHSGKIYDARGQLRFTITALRNPSVFRRLEPSEMERRMREIERFAATGRLAGTIAHEINNPIEAIKNATFLLHGQVKPKAEPVYEILKAETERVSRIVRQMLGLYRHSDQVSTIDVNAVIEDTLALFMRQLEKAGVEVRKELGRLPAIAGSADQFRQVVSNLVVNAKDSMTFTPEELAGRNGLKLALIIRSRHLPAPDGIHGWARITVADTGSGIPPELIRCVFEPFVSTKGEKGTGLGLWIVKGIIENHGGRMRLRSRQGRGTVFKIELPVVR